MNKFSLFEVIQIARFTMQKNHVATRVADATMLLELYTFDPERVPQ